MTRVDAPAQVSDALINACAHFSVIPNNRSTHKTRVIKPTAAMINRVRESSVVQIVGPSGAGKSSLLRGIIESLPSGRTRIVPESLSTEQMSIAVFDLLTGESDEPASSLSLAGLAEPQLWARPAGALSVGEMARLRFAMTMHRAQRGDIVIADEFASTVDRACAYALSRTIRRWAQRLGITLIAASAHEDLERMLAPDLVIDAQTSRIRDAVEPESQAIAIEQGTLEDYQQLEYLHYRSGKPATIVQTLRAMREVPRHIDPTCRMLAGVLLISMPMLNGVWRKRAWAGHLVTRDKATNAARLNAQVRMISRVIVEPRSRGLGIATKLVRAYLDDPITPGSEAYAAMGSVCPFFERAGMTPYEIVPDLPDTRLLDALTYMTIAPEQLLRTQIEPGSLLMRELVTWGKVRKLLPSGKPNIEEVQRLTPIAACRLCSRPRAYAFVKGGWGDEYSNRTHAQGTARSSG